MERAQKVKVRDLKMLHWGVKMGRAQAKGMEKAE